jgi:membrane protein YdbS with pleckstrin-like domain
LSGEPDRAAPQEPDVHETDADAIDRPAVDASLDNVTASLNPAAASPPDSAEVRSASAAASEPPLAAALEQVGQLDEAELAPDHAAFQALDPRSVTLDRIGSFIFTAALAIGALIATAASLALRSQMGWWWLSIPGGCGLLILGLAWLAYYWPGISYRYARYRLAETGLEIRRGVLWRHQISVPAARVQHVDVAEGPLQRQFGLASLVVHTAGTTNASVTLEGLAYPTAQALRDELIRQRESLDVI